MDLKEKKLLKRPVPADTIILGTNHITFREFPGLLERWRNGSTTAFSIVYLKEDAFKFNNNDQLIKSLLGQINMPRDLEYTQKENGEYIYVDFGLRLNLSLL